MQTRTVTQTVPVTATMTLTPLGPLCASVQTVKPSPSEEADGRQKRLRGASVRPDRGATRMKKELEQQM